MRRASSPTLKQWLDTKFFPLINKGAKSQEESFNKQLDDIDSKIESTKKDKRIGEDTREEHIAALKKEMRKVKDRQSQYTNIVKTESDSEAMEKYLKAHPLFDSFMVDDNGNANIYTKMVRNGTTAIGEFRILVIPKARWRNIDRGDCIGVLNMSYRSNELSHWAISEGKCCLSEWEPSFKKYYEEGKIDKLFESVIYFLTLSPSDGAYTTISGFHSGKRALTKEQKVQARMNQEFWSYACTVEGNGKEYDEDSSDDEEDEDTY